MSSQFRIDYVEAALLALLNEKLPAAYGTELGTSVVSMDIDSLGDKDFDDDGQLTLQPPSIRVRFSAGNYDNLRDNRRLTYQANPQFEIWCFESSLRSKADERKQTLVLVGVVQDQLAGARLNLSDGSKAMPITLESVGLIEMGSGAVDQLYAVTITIEGFAQFSGVNAQLP